MHIVGSEWYRVRSKEETDPDGRKLRMALVRLQKKFPTYDFSTSEAFEASATDILKGLNRVTQADIPLNTRDKRQRRKSHAVQAKTIQDKRAYDIASVPLDFNPNIVQLKNRTGDNIDLQLEWHRRLEGLGKLIPPKIELHQKSKKIDTLATAISRFNTSGRLPPNPVASRPQ